mmetsp:Transcript_16440/g.30277  ORF Transcript_16440/g.30277 Transcript_16440/m.30277 type:complete len:212 (+) Transcript_16440:1207-1842(+)
MTEPSAAAPSLWNCFISAARSDRRFASSSGPKQRSNRFFAQVKQCTGFSGVDRIVQYGKTFCVGFAWHSKHSVAPFLMTVTCPKCPVLPASKSGFSAARQRRFTCLRASRLSNAFTTASNFEMYSTPYFGSLMFPQCETILTSGRNCRTASDATSALGLSTCSRRKRNCLFKFDMSMVSRSMTSMSRNPVSTKFLSSSQPIPPAPTIRSLA